MSWSEILAGYVDSFDSYQNRFWFVLIRENLWLLLKDRKKEIFQNVRRCPTEFKLIHFNIMSQVFICLDIPKSRFMKLMYDGALLIHKDEVKACRYIDNYQSFLTQSEIDDLNNLMENCHLDSINNREGPSHHDKDNLGGRSSPSGAIYNVSSASFSAPIYQQGCWHKGP